MSEESAAWLERKYLDWQRERGKRATITAFARWLGVSRGTYNNWTIKKQTPTGDLLKLLGEKLGWEIYEIVGASRPDPMLVKIIKSWGWLDEETKNSIAELLARATRREDSRDSEKNVVSPKPNRTR